MTKNFKTITKKLLTGAGAVTLPFLFTGQVSAAIENPVLGGQLASDPTAAANGTSFANYFANLWNAALVIGAVATLILFVWGAMEWVFSGGEKGHLESARSRILQAVIGLVILVGSYVILSFLSKILFGNSFDILRPQLPSALGK